MRQRLAEQGVLDGEDIEGGDANMIEPTLFPEMIREIYSDLALQTFWIHVRWEYHYRLFREDFVGRFSMLKMAAPTYITVAEQDICNDVIWALCRMTDPASQGWGNSRKNLTIQRLVNEVGNLDEPSLHAGLTSDWDIIDSKVKPLRDFRNTRLGHTDLPTAIERWRNPVELGQPDVRESLFPVVDELVPMMKGVMNQVESRYARPFPYDGIEMAGGWQRMIDLVENGRRYDELKKRRIWRWLLKLAPSPQF